MEPWATEIIKLLIYLAGLLFAGVGGGFIYRFYKLRKTESRADLGASNIQQEFVNAQIRELLVDKNRQISKGLSRIGAMEETLGQVHEQQTKLVVRVAGLELEGKFKDGDYVRCQEAIALLRKDYEVLELECVQLRAENAKLKESGV